MGYHKEKTLDKIEPHVLNKIPMSQLGKRDIKHLKLLTGKEIFPKEAIEDCNCCLQIHNETDDQSDFSDD